MFKKVLLCYDGTAEGRRALRQGADVVITMKSEVHLLAICSNLVATAIPEAVTPELAQCEDDRAQALLDEGVQWLKDRGVHATGSLEYGHASDRISEVAVRIGADLVVLGHKRRSRLERWWSESDESNLLDRISCSVLVATATEP
jgi:nucleotide-binding universal stress UspA family protein